VSNAIWDKAGPLTATEAERLRMHSYYTERMLTRPEALASIGQLAAMAHERLDGSGYHRGLGAQGLPRAARVLAAAGAFRRKVEPRPHREALAPAQAVELLAGEAAAGRLDPQAVDAVLAAAQQPRPERQAPAGLTPRELEVLALLARGPTNRQIADRLHISPKTVSNHVERIYAKAGVSTRAAATLFAMEHGLVPPDFEMG
jgi:HD-GYP domain-containing protein (c-di-GMP phosphodiesterase class II)